jgi:hypothetical protein
VNTQQAQIKVNLPLPLKDYIESKAGKFGMPLAGYIKHLILKDVEDMDFPTFEASDKTIQAYKKAVQEKRNAIEAKSIDDLFKNL